MSFPCLFLLFAFLFFCSSGFSQARALKTFKGVVVDSSGAPVEGVSVTLRGSNKGVTSGTDGSFTIQAAEGATIVLTNVGYQNNEVVLRGNGPIRVPLQRASNSLTDVVVVGYGTQRKATITGAVSNIKSEDLVRTPATTVSAALVGKVQGITARAPDARPGNGTNIQIRNLGNPLYVVDGIPYTGGSTTATSFGFNQGAGQDVFNDLGLEDIESISILKDASASIYGLRAANGVVLVTTKKGKKNEAPSINLSGYYGLQNFTRFPHPANAGEYVHALVESEQNLGRDPSSLYTKEQLAKWEAGTEPGYKSYDYYDMVTRPNVPQTYLSANASGGSQRSNYYFSASNLSQGALIKDFNYSRSNLQANLNTTLANRLQIGAQISAKIEKTHNVGVPGLDDYFNPFLSITSMWPTESPYANDNPLYINQTHNVNVNPATYKNDVTGWVDEWWRVMNVNLTAQYDFKFGLTAKGTYSYNYQNEDFDGFEYTWNAYIYNPTSKTYDNKSATGALYGNQNPWRERHKRNVISRYAQFQLNYSKQLGEHSISAVAAYEKSDYENSYFVVHTIPTNNTISLQYFPEQDVLTDQWAVEARAGYIGRVNYNFRQKYLVELLGRYDGSYLYVPDRRWGFFPAASVGWRISEEPFFKDKVGNFLNDVKIRASYGTTGSESGINAFDYLPGYTFPTGSAILDGAFILGLQPRGLPIVNLSWVTNRTKNIGIDISLLHNKLSGQFDVFERKRTGLPAPRYNVLLPTETGYSLPNENLNSDANRGVEGILTYSSKAGNVNYSIGVNGTLSRLKNLTRFNSRFGNSWDAYRDNYGGTVATTLDPVSHSSNRWDALTWGYHVIGRFTSQQDVDTYNVDNDGQGNRTQLPGDLKFEDANGDHIINGLDQRPIGYAQNAQPYMSFGTNLAVNWKGFNVALDFAGASMQTFRRTVELLFPFQNNGNSAKYMLTDRWHHADPYDPGSPWIEGKYPAIRKGNTTHVNYQPNDFWITNVRYFRSKNIELGYALPKNLIRRLGMSRVRVYANATNLFSFDNLKSLEIDPEVSLGSGLVYPLQKLYTFGFNATF